MSLGICYYLRSGLQLEMLIVRDTYKTAIIVNVPLQNRREIVLITVVVVLVVVVVILAIVVCAGKTSQYNTSQNM